jgi:pimeloyl-ACP methyl ester carboxylesterase
MKKRKLYIPRKQDERSVRYSQMLIAMTCMALARSIRSLSSRLLLRAFSTPIVKLRPTASQKAILDAGERFMIRTENGEATGWRWGRGPTVLLVHGWAGRAAQLTSWVPELTRRGYSVIALDQPAHGEAPGSHTNASVMTEVLLALTSKTGPLAGLVAHSLGGLVSSYAMSQGMEVGSMVLVSTPSAPGPFFESLMKMARIPKARREEVMAGAEALLGATFDSFAIRNSWLGNKSPALIIHDRGDRQVPFASADEILSSIPEAELHETEGLGHNRILNDAGVMEAGVAFIESHAQPVSLRPLAPDFASRMTSTHPREKTLISTEDVMADLAYGRI